jgi:hypothetical protein
MVEMSFSTCLPPGVMSLPVDMVLALDHFDRDH